MPSARSPGGAPPAAASSPARDWPRPPRGSCGRRPASCCPPRNWGAWSSETSGYADLGWAEGVFRDVFFHCRVAAYDVDVSGLEGVELAFHAGHRWWSVEELEDFIERGGTVNPYGMPSLVRELVAGRVPEEPVRLEWPH